MSIFFNFKKILNSEPPNIGDVFFILIFITIFCLNIFLIINFPILFILIKLIGMLFMFLAIVNDLKSLKNKIYDDELQQYTNVIPFILLFSNSAFFTVLILNIVNWFYKLIVKLFQFISNKFFLAFKMEDIEEKQTYRD